jgi:NAD-dependent dihydropyrimidine dehydrogenase PreA subunit
MINIKDNKDCCGCSACASVCPKHCITMSEDSEGFLYPCVDENACIDCHLCEKVCPIINYGNEREPLAVYAAKNPDETIRMQSSSGGIFTLLAERVIDEGGVVFGATFNDRWEVVHNYVETKEELAKFRGSKYVQSKIGDSYQMAKSFLKEGRKVLFSGTPCQIVGLKKYLCKDYDNLLAVDFICHGVPSPGVFRTYLQEEIDKESARKGGGKNTVLHPCIPLITESNGLDCKGLEIKSIAFRDKRNGWKKYGFALGLSKASAAGEKNTVSLSYALINKNPFLKGFLCDLYLRPSCHACPAKQLKSGSDITLGDFWGIESLMPEIDDDKGISAITVNSDKGIETLHSINVELLEVQYNELTTRNPALINSCPLTSKRTDFFKEDGYTFEEKVKRLAKKPFSMKTLAYRIVRKIIPNIVVEKIKRQI